MPTILERFEGTLLGLAIGDALGSRFEGQPAEWIRSRYPSAASLFQNPPGELRYTDDTQMAIGVAETLAEHRKITEETLCRAFLANYEPLRGYGFGSGSILDAMAHGQDYRRVARDLFPEGSFGNGAAMRVAPVGVFFRGDLDRVWEQAGLSAQPTHSHPLGVEGAQVLALAVALASRAERFDREPFFAELLRRIRTDEFRQRIESAARAETLDDVAKLGNGMVALESVPTAVACFALYPGSYEQAVGSAILLGGDTDTIAAMTGAVSGAFLGIPAIPQHLLDGLEDQSKGKTYLRELAHRLHRVTSPQSDRVAV